MRAAGRLVDWGQVQAVAAFVADRAQKPPGGFREDVEALMTECERLATGYCRLHMEEPVPAAEIIERPKWIEANTRGLRAMAGRPLDRYTARFGSGPVSAGALRISGMVVGAQIGALLGYFSTKVLAQYHFVPGDRRFRPRLLMVRPNLMAACKKLGVGERDFLIWIGVHEVTHAVQFSACKWLRTELDLIVKRYMEAITNEVDRLGGLRLVEMLRDPAALLRRIREGAIMALITTPEQRALIDRAQAIMTVVEGHAEHVMHAVGREVLPSYRWLAQLRDEHGWRSAPERLLQKVLGLDLKLRQYRQGRQFVDVVVREGGVDLFNHVWRDPEALPSLEELASPSSWVARAQA